MAKDIFVDLSKSMARKLLTEYTHRHEVLLSQLMDLQSEIDDIANFVTSISAQLNVETNYDLKWPRWEKVEFVLKKYLRLLSVAEIVEELRKYEPELVPNPFHATLSQKVDSKSVFVRYSSHSDSSEYVYGLREWLDENGRMPSSFFGDSKKNAELQSFFIASAKSA